MRKFLRKTLLYILLAPYLIYGLGVASNQLVLYVNHDTFPVRAIQIAKACEGDETEPSTCVGLPPSEDLPDGAHMLDDRHCVMTPRTHLNWLADILDFHDSFQSVGDLLIQLGEWSEDVAPFVWVGAILFKLNQNKE